MVNPIDQAIQDFLPPEQTSLPDYLKELKKTIEQENTANNIITQKLIMLMNGAWLLKRLNPEDKFLPELKEFVKKTMNKLNEPTQRSIRQYVKRFKQQHYSDTSDSNHNTNVPGRF